MYEKQMPNGFKEWKIKAFMKVAEALDRETVTNIIAIGDSQIEIDAAGHLANGFNAAIIKTVKLKEKPSLLELSKQVELVNNSFDEICTSGKNLTIRLQKVLSDVTGTPETNLENDEEKTTEPIEKNKSIPV